jgi:tRNA threonylcarbamoyl adenosine modification protein YjeE
VIPSTFTSHSELETGAFAASLARQCNVGDCVLLYGDLGAGKTAFSRGFIQALMAEKTDITSPTFNVVQTYPSAAGFPLWHCDLYRLKHESELQEMGLDEVLGTGICLIEWPQIAEAYLPKDALSITLYCGASPDIREIEIVSSSDSWLERVQRIGCAS